MTSVAEKAAGAFIDFMHSYDESERHPLDPDRSLVDYIKEWLCFNNTGLYHTGGQPGVCLRVMLHVLHRLMANPRILDYKSEDGTRIVRRQISGVFFERNGDVNEGCADPEEFQVILVEENLKLHLPPLAT